MFLALCWFFISTRINLVCSTLADHQCHPWSFYNDTLQQCQCYKSVEIWHDIPTIKCSARRVLIMEMFCMTTEAQGTFFSTCRSYFSVNYNYTVTVVNGINHIQLPNNVSELNDYMCGPMNRKGRVCSECIDGFSPSVTSMRYPCTNCTGAWYGIPLYLFLEFVPITLFYLAVLVFRISVISPPMTFCVMYSQILAYSFTLPSTSVVLRLSHVHTLFVKIIITLHGIWNLDFFRYIVPPFCVSPNLKMIHIASLGYISALYPVLLIGLTWLSIQLSSHNYRPFVWLWNGPNPNGNSNKPKIKFVDAFATFFFLSYTKLCFLSASLLASDRIHQKNITQFSSVSTIDPSTHYFSNAHIPYIIIGAFVIFVFGLLPAVLLAAYPVRKLRSLFLLDRLSGRSSAALNIFLEKFYSCYKDGLDGGRDMRGFASLHLSIRLLTLLMALWNSTPTMLYGVCCFLVLLVRPCKKSYKNYLDAFILGLLTLHSYLVMDANWYGDFYLWSALISTYLPLLVTYINLIPQKYLLKLKATMSKLSCYKKLSCFKDEEIVNEELSDNNDLDPGRMLHPHQYPGGGMDGNSSERDALIVR